MAILSFGARANPSGATGSPSKWRLASVLLAGTLGLTHQPAIACSPPAISPTAVTGIARTGEISLADGRILRLAGIDWPSPERRGERARLRAALLRLSAQSGAITDASGTPDRWGRLTGQVFLHAADGPPQPVWVQQVILSLGLARAWPDTGVRPCWNSLLVAEDRARRAGIGLWSALNTRMDRLVRKPHGELSNRVLFHGRVRSVRTGRTATFVNFEGKRETAPYLLLRNRELAAWRNEGLDPATFSGKRVRVRAMLAPGQTRRLEVLGPMAVEVLE